MSQAAALSFPGELEAFWDSAMLVAIQQGQTAAPQRLHDSLMVASDAAPLQAATKALSEVARRRPEEVPDALRWAQRLGVITAVTSMGVVLTPCGLCLTTMVTRSYDANAFVSLDGRGRGSSVRVPGDHGAPQAHGPGTPASLGMRPIRSPQTAEALGADAQSGSGPGQVSLRAKGPPQHCECGVPTHSSLPPPWLPVVLEGFG